LSDAELLQQISDKMDKLLRLQALQVVKDIPEEQGKIELLDSLGFRPVDIAKLLNKSPENINVVLSNIRKKKEEKKAKPSNKPQPIENTSVKETTITSADQSKVENFKK
jgi:hypothetical protein